MTEEEYILVSNLTALRAVEAIFHQSVLFTDTEQDEKFKSAKQQIYELRREMETVLDPESR